MGSRDMVSFYIWYGTIYNYNEHARYYISWPLQNTMNNFLLIVSIFQVNFKNTFPSTGKIDIENDLISYYCSITLYNKIL